MSTRLCALCNGIFTGLLVDSSPMPHHQSIASLRRSADAGCYICDYVVAMAPLALFNTFDNGMTFQWSLNTWSERWFPLYRRCYVTYGGLLIRSSNDHLFLFKVMDSASPNVLIHSLDPGANLTDRAVMKTARSWLENCRQNHTLCEPVNPAFNPTRLIYIHDASSVQLIETKEEEKRHAYIAFSHCWGKSEALKLLQNDVDTGTKGNVEELRSLIQVQRLPTSYREAISVSLALGFRHIWIDSLCIIQNSYDDWVKESALMKEVYAQSSLNLCAAAAANPSEASFQSRGAVPVAPLDVEPQWTGIFGSDGNEAGEGKLGPLPPYLRQIKFKLMKDGIAQKEDGIGQQELIDSPLRSRAWVMQERILSRRHLYMTDRQLLWECRDLCASEVFPAGVPDSLDRSKAFEEKRVRHYVLSTPGHHSPDPGAVLISSPVGQTDRTGGELVRPSPSEEPSWPSEYEMDKVWKSFVVEYSCCDLTRLNDKLPALSGLAQTFGTVHGPGFSLDQDAYLAGIWRPYLPMALCWLQNTDSKAMPCRYRLHPYRAPSWSRASMESPVKFQSYYEEACYVADAKVLCDDERYKAGTVKGGILHLRSHVIGPLTYEKASRDESGFKLTPRSSLDGRVMKAVVDLHDSMDITWDETDNDDGVSNPFISYLDQLPRTVHQDGIIKGTGAVRKRVMLEALVEEPRLLFFIVPVTRWGDPCQGLILCQVVNEPDSDLRCFDEGEVFQRVGFFDTRAIKQEVEGLVPEKTIAII